MNEIGEVPPGWQPVLAPVLRTPSTRALAERLRAAGGGVFPPAPLRLAALARAPLDRVKVVIVGQDPYHGAGQANGLAFSVPRGTRLPPSLVNVGKEVARDLSLPTPAHGDLSRWADQGVLLLNTALTVAEGAAGSHRAIGWGPITDAVLAAVAAKPEPCVFLLWGNPARDKAATVPGLTGSHHRILAAPHPSPLSAHRGFIGCGHFSAANAFLEAAGRGGIDWRLA